MSNLNRPLQACYVGFHTYGEVEPEADNLSSGYHNCSLFVFFLAEKIKETCFNLVAPPIDEVLKQSLANAEEEIQQLKADNQKLREIVEEEDIEINKSKATSQNIVMFFYNAENY